ncbi:MAG: protein kinase, partial [Candidatus Sumerlaeia bacterium]|nr:protein kinase [Candidatus Sumerlaeia bacterium]
AVKIKCFNCSEMFNSPLVEDGEQLTCPLCGAPNVIHHGMISFGTSDTDSELNGQPVPNPSSGDVAIPGAVPGSATAPTMDLHEEQTMVLGAAAASPQSHQQDIHEEQTMLMGAGASSPPAPTQQDIHEEQTMFLSSPPPAPPPTGGKGGGASEDDYVPFSGDDAPTLPVSRDNATDPTMALPDQAPTLPISSPAGTGVTSPIPTSEEVTAPTPEKRKEPSRPPTSGVEPSVALEGKTLGGYRIKKRLGAGGMGAVYLAEQLNLDRDVAIKVLPAKYASDPSFIARFTREALSAAQLNHHNIVQVYDIGNEGDIHFISMEYVKGRDLGHMVRKDGKLQPEDAASYVLQAARGLEYAHRHEIVHRDIKPDNMMLNENGIVKIADMGLAKIRGHREASVGLSVPGSAEALREQAYGELTGVEMAMGTPAFMAPEQGRDASTVDHRADQYSLGCTLYYLIAGKTPFSGKTSFEIISQHQTAPVIPLESIVRNVPSELSFIIQKMLAKDPEERYETLTGAIDALEDYLGISAEPGMYTPRDIHVAILEKELAGFHGIGARKLARLVPMVFNLTVIGMAVLGPIALGAMGLSGGGFLFAASLGLLLLTPLFSFLINGFITRTYFFRRARGLVFGTSLKGWGMILGGGILGLLALYFTGLLIPWIVVSFVAAGLAAAWQFLHLKPLRQKEAPHLEATRQMLKELRIRGVAEETIQDFVCRFSEERWEEFFEAIFGYEDMINQRARSIHLDKVKPRKRHATWRDPIARWMDDVEEARRREREKRQLAKAEKQRLKAEGVSDADAEKQAFSLASKAVDDGLLKETAILPAASRSDVRKANKEREKLAADLHKSGKRRLPSPNFLYRFARFLAGAVVLVGAVIPIAGMWDTLPAIAQGLMNQYYRLSMIEGAAFGATFYALAPGIALLISAFSRRILLPTLIVLAAIVSVASVAVMALNPSPTITAAQMSFAGAGASVVLLLLLLFTRNRRREF